MEVKHLWRGDCLWNRGSGLLAPPVIPFPSFPLKMEHVLRCSSVPEVQTHLCHHSEGPVRLEETLTLPRFGRMLLQTCADITASPLNTHSATVCRYGSGGMEHTLTGVGGAGESRAKQSKAWSACCL